MVLGIPTLYPEWYFHNSPPKHVFTNHHLYVDSFRPFPPFLHEKICQIYVDRAQPWCFLWDFYGGPASLILFKKLGKLLSSRIQDYLEIYWGWDWIPKKNNSREGFGFLGYIIPKPELATFWRNYLTFQSFHHHLGDRLAVNGRYNLSRHYRLRKSCTSWYTLLGTNISPFEGILESMIFLYPMWVLWSFPGRYANIQLFTTVLTLSQLLFVFRISSINHCPLLICP